MMEDTREFVKQVLEEPQGIRDELIFKRLNDEARVLGESELMGEALHEVILSATSLAEVLADVISRRLASNMLPRLRLKQICFELLRDDEKPGLDVCATLIRDPATLSFLHCVLFVKGFHAMTTHRVAAKLWAAGSMESKHEALCLQHRASELWGVDVHPAAAVGHGLLVDHATGIVIGETARLGNDCTILHGVTLGGTGKERGKNRHPKIGDRVVIGAGATVLGNIHVGDDVTIGAMAVVTKPVPDRMTVVGLNRILDPRHLRDAVQKRKETWWAEVDSSGAYDYFDVNEPIHDD